MPFSWRSSQPRDRTQVFCIAGRFFTIWAAKEALSLVCLCARSLSHVWLFVTLWTVACQAPLSMGLSREEYWSGLPWPPPGDLPDPGITAASLLCPALAGRFFTTSATWEVPLHWYSSSKYVMCIKTIPNKKECKKAKWLSQESLEIAEKRREAKGKGEKERSIHLNAEFQRIARRNKKTF